jgi:hypothetical protein
LLKNNNKPMSELAVEAARYALLRRLAPAIRHRVVGKLHPIGLIAEALEWQIQEATPNLKTVRESLARVSSMSRVAMQAFTSEMTWLTREEGATVAVAEGVDDCLGLLHTEFELRGFSLKNEVKVSAVRVSLNAVRNVLAAALIAISDSAPAPAILVLSADVSKTHASLTILVHPAEAVSLFETPEPYRPMAWDDVQALAAAESVELSRSGASVELRYRIQEDVRNQTSHAIR